MRHIFYIHSNICIISLFDKVLSLINGTDDELVFLQDRGVQWPFHSDRVILINVQDIITGKPLNLRQVKAYNIVYNYIKYKVYLNRLRKRISTLVNGKEFVFYTPIYNNELPHILTENKYCRGYYFIEEGSLDYLPLKRIKQISIYTKQALFKKITYPLIGERFFFILHVGKKYKGCISISNEAFQFLPPEHIVNGVSLYERNMPLVKLYDNIIVTGYLFEDDCQIEKCLRKTIEHIPANESIALKIHPEVYSRYPNKIDLINCILQSISRQVVLLPVEESVELILIRRKSSLYSLFTKSSLIIYGLNAGCKSYSVCMVNDKVNFFQYHSVRQYVDDIITNSNYK